MRTRRLLRRRERRGLAGATYMAIGYFLSLAFFPLAVAVAAMAYNALGDAASALVGRRGAWRARWGKSVEGLFAGFAVNSIVGLAVPGLPLTAAVVGAAGAAILEFLPLPLDDNLVITLGGGLTLWVTMGLVG